MKEKWSFLRKGSKFEEEVKGKGIKTIAEDLMNFPDLESVFGKCWLESQKKIGFFPFLQQRLGDLEIAIKELKNVRGFEDWKTNVTLNPREFDSYEFEILEISRLQNLVGSLEIYPPVGKGNMDQTSLSELIAVRNEIEFYVEMTKMRSITNPKNKIRKLIEKGRRQIPKNSAGFIFADVSDVTLREDISYEKNELICKVVSNLDALSNEVNQFFRGKNTRILGVVFVEYYLASDENYKVAVAKQYCMKRNRYNKLGLDLTQVGDPIFPKK